MEQETSLLNLPDELLQSIFALVPLPSLVAAQSSCRRLFELAEEPLLWRDHCISGYRFWDNNYDFVSRCHAPAAETDWKQLLMERKVQDKQVLRSLNNILETRVNRTIEMQNIVDLGYDAKDMLLGKYNIPEDASDVLARKYWCNEALGCVERAEAIQTWERLSKEEDIPLEQALGVFDLFTTERPPQTLSQISDLITDLATAFRKDNAESTSPRATSISLITWLRARNLLGIDDHTNYYDLQNSLISIALNDSPGHPSSPIISVGIFCCVARRLGLNAFPCGLPSHVVAIIESNPGYTLDGQPSASPDSALPQRMYLDPWTDDRELSTSTLSSQLRGYGITTPSEQSLFLTPLSPKDMVTRISRNITNSRRFSTRDTPESDHPLVRSLGTTLHRPAARYAAAWATVLFTAPAPASLSNQPPDPTRQRDLLESLNQFLPALEPRFAIDLPLVHTYIVPLARSCSFLEPLMRVLASVGAEDARALAPQPRSGDAAGDKVKYRVGDVFRHRRFGYTGVVVGWDTRCEMDDDWIAQMRVDSLAHGREQCFYHSVVAGDESVRYVAEENIEIIEGDGAGVPVGLERVAGKWFKRWEGGEGRFVSNVRGDYPDD